MLPIIGITANEQENRDQVAIAYANSVRNAGGIPIILPSITDLVSHFLTICDGFVFTGGGDPRMEEWKIQTHPNANPVSPVRQAFELALLRALYHHQAKPVLGVCLGMQWMSLLAGGTLDQDLSEQIAPNHKKAEHYISGAIGEGIVQSHHHQAITNAGNLEVVARADDGVIEAVQDINRLWYVGVQWHPERTEDVGLGQGIFNQLVEKCAKAGVALQ